MLESINKSNLYDKCLVECQSKVRADKLANTASGIWKSQCKCTAEINLVVMFWLDLARDDGYN